MLKRGDAVVHPTHGAGVLRATQTRREVSGVKRRYHRIELVSGRGTLFVPTDHVQEAGLLPVPGDAEQITSILSDEPQSLSDDYQKRKADLAAKVQSGDISLVAEVLRDLSWRERELKLSNGDAQLKADAQEKLAGVLSLQLDLDVEAATHELSLTVSRSLPDSLDPDKGG